MTTQPEKYWLPPPCLTPMAASIWVIWWNTSRPTYGCASRKCKGTVATMFAPTIPTARPSCCAPKRKASRPEQLIARVWQEHYDDFKAFHVNFDHYGSTNSAETREFANAHIQQAEEQRPDREALHRAVLRPGQGNVPAGPLHQGRMPQVSRQGPVRRQLRSVRRGLYARPR